MCGNAGKYARFTEPGNERGTVREVAALAKERENDRWLTHNCGQKIPKSGHARLEFACHDCFVSKGWDYELRTFP
jgi:hypothetical protein